MGKVGLVLLESKEVMPEISVELPAITDLITRGDLGQVQQRQRSLAHKILHCLTEGKGFRVVGC